MEWGGMVAFEGGFTVWTVRYGVYSGFHRPVKSRKANN